MEKYRISYNLGSDNFVGETLELENPNTFLEELKLEGTRTFTSEKGIIYKINLSEVKYVKITKYQKATVRSYGGRF